MARMARGGSRRTAAAAALAWCSASATVGSACDFQYDVDPYTQYFGLEPDYSAYSPEDCTANCCADPSCDVWQYTDMPMGGVANCMHGVSYDYGDSGGIYWTGAEGRTDGDPDTGGGGKKKKTRKQADELDVEIFLIVFGALASAYLVSGTYYGVAVQKKSGVAALPNAMFWSEVGGLVKDGAAFTLSGGTARGQAPAARPYAPLPDAEAPILAQPGVGGVAGVSVAVAAVVVAAPEARRKKVRVKREKGSSSSGSKKVRTNKSSGSSSSMVSSASLE